MVGIMCTAIVRSRNGAECWEPAALAGSFNIVGSAADRALPPTNVELRSGCAVCEVVAGVCSADCALAECSGAKTKAAAAMAEANTAERLDIRNLSRLKAGNET